MKYMRTSLSAAPPQRRAAVRPGLQGALVAVAAAGTLFGFWHLLDLSVHRALDPDEFQHIQFAWLVGQGLVPYRDFFEHHTPLFHVLFAPLFLGFDVATKGQDAVDAVLAFRWIALILAAMLVVGTAALGRRAGGGSVWAAVAALLLALNGTFWLRAIEVRPDHLAALFLLGAVACTVVRRGGWGVGALTGLAVLSTQKGLFAIPGLGVGLAIAALVASEGGWKAAVAELVRATVAGLAMLGLALGGFAVFGAHGAFVHDNFLMNARWAYDVPPWGLINRAVSTNPEWLALWLGGTAIAAIDLVRGWRPCQGPLIGLGSGLAAGSMALGLAIIPIAQPQYLFLFLPLGAVAASYGVARAFEAVCRAGRVRFAAGAVVILGGVSIVAARALLAAVPGGSADHFGLDRAQQFRQIRYVVESTGPDETIMNGWWTAMLFRKPATKWFFMHGELRMMLTPEDWAALRQGLETGAVSPVLIGFDRGLARVPDSVSAYLAQRYAPIDPALGELRRVR